MSIRRVFFCPIMFARLAVTIRKLWIRNKKCIEKKKSSMARYVGTRTSVQYGNDIKRRARWTFGRPQKVANARLFHKIIFMAGDDQIVDYKHNTASGHNISFFRFGLDNLFIALFLSFASHTHNTWWRLQDYSRNHLATTRIPLSLRLYCLIGEIPAFRFTICVSFSTSSHARKQYWCLSNLGIYEIVRVWSGKSEWSFVWSHQKKIESIFVVMAINLTPTTANRSID